MERHNPAYQMTDAYERTYAEIGARVARIRETYPQWEIWGLISSRPITTNSIDSLILEGWAVGFSDNSSCHYQEKNITLLIDLEQYENSYQRDVTLFHEIAHAWYGDALDDRLLRGARCHDDRTIAEWLARQKRAEPELLRYAILSFGLAPQVYDRASYEAFAGQADLDLQLVFPFAQEYYERLKPLLMDGTPDHFPL
jgi:hypothetical protein